MKSKGDLQLTKIRDAIEALKITLKTVSDTHTLHDFNMSGVLGGVDGPVGYVQIDDCEAADAVKHIKEMWWVNPILVF